MLRLRKENFNVLRRLSNWSKKSRVEQPETSAHLASITSAIWQRQAAGLTTTLRQLHTITQMSQGEALNMVAELERRGLATIDRHEGDAFESTITLDENAKNRLSAQSAGRR